MVASLVWLVLKLLGNQPLESVWFHCSFPSSTCWFELGPSTCRLHVWNPGPPLFLISPSAVIVFVSLRSTHQQIVMQKDIQPNHPTCQQGAPPLFCLSHSLSPVNCPGSALPVAEINSAAFDWCLFTLNPTNKLTEPGAIDWNDIMPGSIALRYDSTLPVQLSDAYSIFSYLVGMCQGSAIRYWCACCMGSGWFFPARYISQLLVMPLAFFKLS